MFERLMEAGVRQGRRIGAYGVCLDVAGRVLLVRGSATDDRPGWWALPGGGVEHGEHPRDTLSREYREETGLSIESAALSDVTSDLLTIPSRGLVKHTDRLIYRVRCAAGTPRREPDGTTDRAEWVAPERLDDLTLMPYARQALGLPPGPAEEVPEAEPVPRTDPGRAQRFGAYGLVTDPAGRLLLTLISPGYPGAGSWHLPGGGTEFGEQATAGLLREIDEETGQVGRVTALLAVGHYHNPTAYGPERRPMDWHTVRATYRVVVDEPSEPRVIEAAGSTAEARWFDLPELSSVRLTEFARTSIEEYLR